MLRAPLPVSLSNSVALLQISNTSSVLTDIHVHVSTNILGSIQFPRIIVSHYPIYTIIF